MVDLIFALTISPVLILSAAIEKRSICFHLGPLKNEINIIWKKLILKINNITWHHEEQQTNNFLGQIRVIYYNHKKKGHTYH